jgi:hypothetical protein
MNRSLGRSMMRRRMWFDDMLLPAPGMVNRMRRIQSERSGSQGNGGNAGKQSAHAAEHPLSSIRGKSLEHVPGRLSCHAHRSRRNPSLPVLATSI